MKTVYVTDDGSAFDTVAQAEAHENRVSTKAQDLKDLKEALSKALILVKSSSLSNHEKTQSIRWEIEKFLKTATTSDEYYSSSDNC